VVVVLGVSIASTVAVQVLAASIANQPRLPNVVSADANKAVVSRRSTHQRHQRTSQGPRPSQDAARFNRRPDSILLTADHKVVDGFAGGGFQGLSVCRLDRLDVVASILVVGEDAGNKEAHTTPSAVPSSVFK
jgi:hypothetical protein